MINVFTPVTRRFLPIILLSLYSLFSCEGVVSKPFDAKVIAVMEKNDGNGYAIVLNSTSDPNVWVAASVTKKVERDDILVIDKVDGKVSYKGKMIGRIIDRR